MTEADAQTEPDEQTEAELAAQVEAIRRRLEDIEDRVIDLGLGVAFLHGYLARRNEIRPRGGERP